MPDTRTREMLLDAGERLIAELGLDAVSLRMIMAEAGANPAAVHYHFGSRDGLLEAIFERRMGLTEPRRRVMMEALERSGRPSVRELLRALVRPLLELPIELGEPGVRYLAFLAQVMRARSPVLMNIIARDIGDTLGRLVELLALALPELPPRVVVLRLLLGLEAALGALVDPELLVVGIPDGEQPDPGRLEALLLDFMEGGLVFRDSSPEASFPERET